MQGIIPGENLTGRIDAIQLENIEKITGQMKNSICRVYGYVMGTGFFCKIPYKDKCIPVLITSYDLINDDFLNNHEKIEISFNDGNKNDEIKINKNSKLYSSEINEFNIMIIKLEEEKNIYQYLELDEQLFDEYSEEIYKDKSIYTLHYPKDDNKVCVSFGYGIKKYDEYYFKHQCNIGLCSSGAPILNLKTNKIIGIYSEATSHNLCETIYNMSILLKYPLNKLNGKEAKPLKKNKEEKELKKENNINNELVNEIKIAVKINENDINKAIYFLDNTDFTDDKGIDYFNNNLKELNELNTELYINDKKYGFKKYFYPDKEGIYIIKLKFNINIKDLSFMFAGCRNILNIDLSSFQDTKNVNNMSDMFGSCISLTSLPDISEWDTKNVNNMHAMFSCCTALESLPDISEWDTKNVNDMSFMFDFCNSLQSLPDISKWDTKNVNNMSNMFHCCNKLKSLPDISKWDVKNVNDFSGMFCVCRSLKSFPDIDKWDTKNANNMCCMFDGCDSLESLPDISKWDVKNVNNMCCMFRYCKLLKSLPDISKWDTRNVNNMNGMFHGCKSLEKIPDKFD